MDRKKKELKPIHKHDPDKCKGCELTFKDGMKQGMEEKSKGERDETMTIESKEKKRSKEVEEFLIAIGEEYLKGIEHTIQFLRKEGIICKKEDNCSECNKIDIFYNKRYKEVSQS